MANNPYVNKVQKADGTTIIDITPTTAVASDVSQGKYFFTASGELTLGTLSGGGGTAIIRDTTDSAGGTIREITTDEELYLTSLSATQNQTYTAPSGTAYDEVVVNVSASPNLQAKTNISPTTSSQTVTADNGYDGLSSVQINAMPTMTLPTSASSSATTGYTSKATISRSTSDQYINIPTGYNSAGAYYKINATPNGTVTAPSTISGSSATVSTGTNTLTLSKTVSVTPTVSTAGYVSSGTSGNSNVSLTASVTTQGAKTVTPSTSQQTAVSSGTYVTGNVVVSAMPIGTAGTPTATKGAVSNHSVSVTPSVTNTTGYITGSTKTGTAVTVTASELASGNKEITSNGTNIDVVGYSTVSVAVPSSARTCTITNSGDSNSLFVKYNNTNYYTANSTFTFSGGGTLYITCSYGNSNGISLNGDNVVSPTQVPVISYAFTLPDCDIEISFTKSVGTSAVAITAPYLNITSNGNYDVGSYGYAKVNVSGGSSGLEYEEGTWTPSSDVTRGTILFTNTHTKPPSIVILVDAYSENGSVTTANSDIAFVFVKIGDILGDSFPWYQTSETSRSNLLSYISQSTVTTSPTVGGYGNISDDVGSTDTYSSYYATSAGFYPYARSTTRYWRSGREYKWKAIWL